MAFAQADGLGNGLLRQAQRSDALPQACVVGFWHGISLLFFSESVALYQLRSFSIPRKRKSVNINLLIFLNFFWEMVDSGRGQGV
jgi:hypothetical protein